MGTNDRWKMAPATQPRDVCSCPVEGIAIPCQQIWSLFHSKGKPFSAEDLYWNLVREINFKDYKRALERCQHPEWYDRLDCMDRNSPYSTHALSIECSKDACQARRKAKRDEFRRIRYRPAYPTEAHEYDERTAGAMCSALIGAGAPESIRYHHSEEQSPILQSITRHRELWEDIVHCGMMNAVPYYGIECMLCEDARLNRSCQTCCKRLRAPGLLVTMWNAVGSWGSTVGGNATVTNQQPPEEDAFSRLNNA